MIIEEVLSEGSCSNQVWLSRKPYQTIPDDVTSKKCQHELKAKLCTNKIGCVHGPEHTVHEQDWMCAWSRVDCA